MSGTPQVSRCRSCDEAIVWMKTVNGKNIPVDADTVDEADLEWQDGAPLFDREQHTTHFETCPDADQHRRR